MLKYWERDYEFMTALIPKSFNGKLIQELEQIFYYSNYRESINTYCEMIKSENTLVMYQGLVCLRKFISFTRGEQFNSKQRAVCEQNTLKYIIHIIEYNENQLILYEALWILRTLTYESTIISYKIIENGSLNCLVRKFSSGYYHDFIIEQVCWIFANVTDDLNFRSCMAKLEILSILNNYAMNVNYFENQYLIDPLAKAIRNCFRYKSILLKKKDIEVSLKIFQNWIQEKQSTETYLCICQSFAIYADIHPSNIQIIIDFEIMPRIIELFELQSQSDQLLLTNLRIVQIILESHQVHQEYLYGIGIIPCFGRLIKKYNYFPSIIHILQVFEIKSFSKQLLFGLLNSNEFDLLCQLIDIKEYTVQNFVHNYLENLIKAFQNIDMINLIKSKKLIQLCKIYISRNQTKQRCQIIINLCDKYLQDDSSSEKEELLELKQGIVQKLNDLQNDESNMIVSFI